LLDMVRYTKFSLAQIWTDELGDPSDPAEFAFLYAYSPYHRVTDGTEYPAMLFTTGDNDVRVDPAHSRKMVARLQQAKPDGRAILLRYERNSGHGGSGGISNYIETAVDEKAFLMDAVGLAAPTVDKRE